MIPTEVTNALMCGIPLVLSAGMYDGFDFLRVRRNQSGHSDRDAAARRQSWPHLETGLTLRVVVAKSPEHRTAANDLVRKRYARRGYHVEVADDAIEARQKRSAQEITFLVASDRAAVGTLTLGLDGPSGLLAEAAYGAVIREFRVAGHRVCELTRLALAESIDSKTVLATLFSLAHAVGRTVHDVTHVFIEVNPRHVGFYCRVLGFAVAAGEKLCERVRARSVLLALEIEALEERLTALGAATDMQPLFASAASAAGVEAAIAA